MKARARGGWAAAVVLGAGLALVAGCGSNVVVDESATGTGGAGASGTGGGQTTGAGGGSVSTVPPGGECPPAAPAMGTPCHGSLSCTYGGGWCPPVFDCVGGVWQDTAGACPPPACPGAVPQPGSACPMDGQSCAYDQQCGGAQATCSGGQWQVSTYGVGCAEMCPAELPVQGAACDFCCMQNPCSYPVPGCQPSVAACEPGGTWAISPGDCPPPPMSFCGFHAAAADCQADPGCRWLEPGCSDPKLPAAGCFDENDCQSDADCKQPGLSCMPVIVDPCWNKGCDLCVAKATVCVSSPSP